MKYVKAILAATVLASLAVGAASTASPAAAATQTTFTHQDAKSLAGMPPWTNVGKHPIHEQPRANPFVTGDAYNHVRYTETGQFSREMFIVNDNDFYDGNEAGMLWWTQTGRSGVCDVRTAGDAGYCIIPDVAHGTRIYIATALCPPDLHNYCFPRSKWSKSSNTVWFLAS